MQDSSLFWFSVLLIVFLHSKILLKSFWILMLSSFVSHHLLLNHQHFYSNPSVSFPKHPHILGNEPQALLHTVPHLNLWGGHCDPHFTDEWLRRHAPELLQERGPLPGPKTGLLSNTRKWIVWGDKCADKARDFIGTGHPGGEQQGKGTQENSSAMWLPVLVLSWWD